MSDPKIDATPEEIRIGNLEGEIELLKAMVRHLLETRPRTVGKPGPNLAAQLISTRKRLGEGTAERIAFEHAYKRFGEMWL